MAASSFRVIKTPFSLLHPPNLPIPKTLISLTTSPLKSHPKLSSFRSVSFQRLPTKPHSSQTSQAHPPLQPVEELPPKLQEIVKLFQAAQEPKTKYQQLLVYGKNLSPLDPRFKTPKNKVQGCVSQVWVRAFLDPDNNVSFEADSDSLLTKGLAALLVQGLSGHPVEEILRVSPDFVLLLGLQQSLTPSRNNGFLNMLKLMQKKALLLYVEAKKGGGNDLAVPEASSLSGQSPDLSSETGSGGGASVTEAGSGDFDANPLGSRGQRIWEKLERELRPVELVVEDISHEHVGHAGARGSDGETHFNVKVVAEEFEGKSLFKRHRLIYNLLQEELQSGLHALSIVANTPSEVNQR